jgi:hypothetical protein
LRIRKRKGGASFDQSVLYAFVDLSQWTPFNKQYLLIKMQKNIKILHSKRNNQQSEERTYRKGEFFCQILKNPEYIIFQNI